MIYIPGIIRVDIKDINTTQFTIEDLYPGSLYDCTIVVTSKDFSKSTYKLDLKTTGEPVLGKKLSDLLVGKTFQNVGFSGQVIKEETK